MDFELRPQLVSEFVCEQFGIELEDFLLLLQGKKKIKDEQTILFVIEEYIQLLQIDKKKSKNTVTNYTAILKKLQRFILDGLSEKKMFELDVDFFYNFLATCKPKKEEELSPRTINTYQAVIKNLIELAYNRKYINEDLRDRFKNVGDELKPRYIPDELIKQLLREAKYTSWPFLNWSLIYFMLTTGCRISEAIRLRICDFNINEDVIFIRKSKNNKERYIPMYPEVKKAMLDYLSRTGLHEWSINNQEPFFTKRCYDKREPLQIRNVQYTMEQLYIKLQMKGKYTVHGLRHTFAVSCLKERMPIEILQQVLGHKSIETTRVYVQLLPNDLKDEVTKKYPFPFEKLMKNLLGIGAAGQ